MHKKDSFSFEDFSSQVTRYRLESVLHACTGVAWNAWIKGKEKTQNQDPEELLAIAISSRIVPIAAAIGNNFAAENLDPNTFRNLCLSYLEIDEPLTAKNYSEYEVLLAELNNSEILKHFKNDEVSKFLVLRLFGQRTIRQQWEQRSFQPDSIERSWAVMTYLFRRIPEFESRLTKILSVEPIVMLRSGYALLGLAQDTSNGTLPGAIDFSTSNITPELKSIYNIDNDSLQLVARRWSWAREDFKNWHDKLTRDGKNYYKQFAPNPLMKGPLLQLDRSFLGIRNSNDVYLCPSPWYVGWKMRNFAFEALSESLSGPELGLYKVEVGEALEDYMHDALQYICFPENVFRVPKEKDKKTADFIVKEEDSALIIELKRSFSGMETKTTAEPRLIKELFERMFIALCQCSNTLKSSHLKEFKNTAIVLCVDDLLLLEGRCFSMYAHKSGMLEKLGIDCFEVFSTTQLENKLCKHSPSQLVRSINEKWNRIRRAENFVGEEYGHEYLDEIQPNKNSDRKFLTRFRL
jgi:hypothetical protein